MTFLPACELFVLFISLNKRQVRSLLESSYCVWKRVTSCTYFCHLSRGGGRGARQICLTRAVISMNDRILEVLKDANVAELVGVRSKNIDAVCCTHFAIIVRK
jgi:hypothetical protein